MQSENAWLVVTAILFAVFSFCMHLYGKHKLAILFLFFSALFVRLFIVYLDPFLHDWDERFHALVARNLMDNPFKPILHLDTLLPYDYKAWTENHIWLHKQPLFLWQMALSVKIFGVSEFAIRYPSALMGALMVIFTYRISWRLTKDRLLSYGAALLLCFSNYQLELISGYIGMDHNDVAFCFYVFASIWAYVESIHDRRFFWIVLIGFFAGCAVLNKWLTGFLVFAGWGLNILLSIKTPEFKKEVFRFILAFVVCLIVFVPWQLYILHSFPLEASNEYSYNSKHVFDPVENHGGDFLFYYKKLPQYFGLFTWYIVIIGAVVYLFSKTEERKIKYLLGVSFLLVFLFFSVVVKTKMQSYLFVVAPVGFIFMAFAIVKTIDLLKLPGKLRTLVSSLGLFICAGFLFNYEGITSYFHNPDDAYRILKTKNTDVYKNLEKHIKPGTHYILNLSQFSEAELMFYNKNIAAFHGNLDKKDIETLNQTQTPVGIFKNHSRYTDANFSTTSPQFYVIETDLGDL